MFKVLAPLLAAGGGLTALVLPTLLWVARHRGARQAALRSAGQVLKRGAQHRLGPRPAETTPTWRGAPVHVCQSMPHYQPMTFQQGTTACPYCGERLPSAS